MIKREPEAAGMIKLIYEKKYTNVRDVDEIKIIVKELAVKFGVIHTHEKTKKTTTTDWHTPVAKQSNDGCSRSLGGPKEDTKHDGNKNGRSTNCDDVRCAYIARTTDVSRTRSIAHKMEGEREKRRRRMGNAE